MTNVTEVKLNERAQHLLKTLVQYYIREGQPVGSTTLLRESKLELSSATVRNVIADLERLGLVRSPHTSAGRIPTVEGYRMFIDNLLTVKPMDQQEVERIKIRLSSGANTKVLVESASSMLSALTRMAGVVMLPDRKQAHIRHIEFLPLSDRRVLAIMVFDKGEVQNRIIHIDRNYSQQELVHVSNCLNTELVGKDVLRVRESLLKQMREARDSMDRLMLKAIEMAQQVFAEETPQHDFVMAGEANLMKYEDMADITRLRQLFEAFNEKRGILHLLDQSLNAPGVQIFVGNESGYEALDDCSVVTATYSDGDRVLGALGVIGPTRMAYDRVIPIVDVTAKLLGTILKERS
ncbi:MAG: heat-inducible transcriptional repressor HrcA [Gammaproteobacteria bacterium]|nr:heat-inducible transcriptional repressor HrcA [Gammaproteobacteria bacterium]